MSKTASRFGPRSLADPGNVSQGCSAAGTAEGEGTEGPVSLGGRAGVPGRGDETSARCPVLVSSPTLFLILTDVLIFSLGDAEKSTLEKVPLHFFCVMQSSKTSMR